MALLHWLHKRLAGDEKAELIISEDEDSLSGLNLKEVLNAHMAWRKRLKDSLEGVGTESFEVGDVAQDNLCVLGKWLYGPGKTLYANSPEYKVLRRTHTDFHLCAGEILLEHQRGNATVAENLLKDEFRDISNKIQLDLVKLFTSTR